MGPFWSRFRQCLCLVLRLESQVLRPSEHWSPFFPPVGDPFRRPSNVDHLMGLGFLPHPDGALELAAPPPPSGLGASRPGLCIRGTRMLSSPRPMEIARASSPLAVAFGFAFVWCLATPLALACPLAAALALGALPWALGAIVLKPKWLRSR